MAISLSKNISRTDTSDTQYTEINPTINDLKKLLYEVYGRNNNNLTVYDMLCVLVGQKPNITNIPKGKE